MMQLYDVDWQQEPMQLIIRELQTRGVDYMNIVINRDSLNNDLYHTILFDTDDLSTIIDAINHVWLVEEWRTKYKDPLCFSTDTKDYILLSSVGRLQENIAVKGLALPEDVICRTPDDVVFTSFNNRTKTYGVMHVAQDENPHRLMAAFRREGIQGKYRIGTNVF